MHSIFRFFYYIKQSFIHLEEHPERYRALKFERACRDLETSRGKNRRLMQLCHVHFRHRLAMVAHIQRTTASPNSERYFAGASNFRFPPDASDCRVAASSAAECPLPLSAGDALAPAAKVSFPEGLAAILQTQQTHTARPPYPIRRTFSPGCAGANALYPYPAPSQTETSRGTAPALA